ncbi:uncharacterized protein LOC114531443 [Dendronephthya gigantea]|uniref:uncharacterized protein LOC114531443 n=1 Tax=Dendronephthya gigantea TaxID=151771 RepID=UPI00106D8914|nr:uncharacterized protein LOC114531443 [Dendronephthya gigantea]
MKREKLSIRILSAKRSFDAYEEAVRNLEKAYNITKENRLKKNRILTKTMMLKNFTSEQSQSHIKITDIGFETKVLPQQDTNVLLLNIKLQLIKKKQELSTLLDFQNLKRSLRSIAKEILGEYVDENAQVTRKKRSTLNKNDLNFEFYTLQSFHRLCSEFSNYKETLSEVVTSLFEMAKNLQKLRNEELERKKSLLINGSAILENFNVNGNKYDIAVNYDSYLNALETDPEVSEAKNVQNEALENEFGAVRSSSILFNKNWLATMESMFAEYSGECSGFEDCMKYIFDGLLDITIGSSALNGDKLREQILNLERKFFNLTSKSDMSVNEAVHVSRDLLRDVKDMSGVEDVCAHAPNITQQPEPFTELGVNETLVLSCGATGDFLVYQWRFNGEVLTNQRTNILRINNTSPSHSGNYSCDASNHIAKASSIVAVVVIGTPPLIVAHPIRRLNVVLSEYSSLHCKVEEDARNTSFQWWFKSPNSSSFVLIPNEKFSYLSFVPVKLHNEGWYFCNVSNSFGHTISKLSFVQVLKYSLPVPVAKLSLTIISKYPRNETLMNYRDALANNLESRLVILKQRLTSGGELLKDLHATECNIITEYNDELERTQICDWTFRVFGENVTSTNKFKGSAESQDAEKLLNASYNLKNYFVEQIDNNLNAFRFNFFLGNSNHSTMRNSLRVLGISLICPKGQFFVDNVYKCAQCPPGFQGVLVNGTATCAVCPRGFYQSRPGATFCNKCPQGFTTAGEGAIDEKQCEDIDECTIGTGKCDGQATCNNTIGSYSCGCDVGYVQNETMCVDVDECTLQTDNCGSQATCSNTIGSFTCDCNEGYSWKGITCVDVDECTLGTDNCHSQATCSNTIGSFSCDCNEGYSGNGITCVDVDECTIGADNCGSQATCRNTIGSFTCNCNEGYSGNGISCVDVDECTNGSDNCHSQATCSNTMGSFKCTCNEGYTGSGTTCVAEKKYFLYLYLVNEHHKDAIVTINISGRLEKIYLKSTTTKVISKVWTTRSWLTASAVEAGTYRALEINRQSVIRMEPTTMKHLSVKALVIGSRTY